MVNLSSQSLLRGLVLSLSLSSHMFLTSNAQGSTATPPSTRPTTTSSSSPSPSQPASSINAPSGFVGVASAANKNFIFYQGGQVNTGSVRFTNDLFSLDLTKTWPVHSPAWTNLTLPSSGTLTGPTVSGHDATMSKDGTTLLVTAPTESQGTPFLYQYNIAAGSWSTIEAPSAQASKWASRKAANFVTDPASGISWLLGGAFPDGSSTNEIDRFQDNTWTANLIPSSNSNNNNGGALNNFNSGTAHIFNNRIYIFGGFSSTAGRRGYQSFQSLPYIDVSNPDTLTHGVQFTLGQVPPPRQDHCSVITASHKVIIFGGYDGNSKLSLSDVWSLDLITWTWSQIVTTNSNQPRHGHTCDIAGANMVVYGGMAAVALNSPQIAYGKDVQVYDVMLSTWMKSYAPKQDTTTTSQPLPGTGGSNSGLGIGPIIGIVIGVASVIACIAAFFIYKRRQKQIEIREAEMEKEAYLASLRPEGSNSKPGNGGQSPTSPRSARLAAGSSSINGSIISTPGMTHAGAYNGMDELLLSNAAASPAMGGQAQGNVQYLMQHLPDGTIAVQPVYLDHQTALQMSPNLADLTSGPLHPGNGYASPLVTGSTVGPASSAGYFAPPPQQKSQVTYPQPTHDPFASPSLPNAPLPPGYNPPPSVGATGLSSPQQRSTQLR